MKKIIALSLLAVTTGAFAQGTGFYMGGGVGQSNTEFNSEDFSLDDPSISESKDHQDMAWKFFAGYNTDRHVGVEAGYVSFGTAGYNYTGVSGSAKYKAEQSSWFAAAKVNLPINEQFNFFGKLGLTRNQLEASLDLDLGWILSILAGSVSKTSLLYGVGAQYNSSEQVGIRVEYENFGEFGDEVYTGRTKVDMFSASVTLNF